MLFHVYGENALPQWIAMLGVLAALILLNEVARRTKAGGIFMFFVIPAIFCLFYCNCRWGKNRSFLGTQ